ncbi:MAG: hypothetical protein JSS32_00530 [Verrucomicrobia bacterium]|nr:hypothetical protein [Verrucomicrobiota bacterium]
MSANTNLNSSLPPLNIGIPVPISSPLDTDPGSVEKVESLVLESSSSPISISPSSHISNILNISKDEFRTWKLVNRKIEEFISKIFNEKETVDQDLNPPENNRESNERMNALIEKITQQTSVTEQLINKMKTNIIKLRSTKIKGSNV